MSLVWFILLIIILFAVIIFGAYIHLGVRALLRRRPPDDENTPAVYGLSFEEVTFDSQDGLRLSGRFILASELAPRGTVIFCHGQAGSMDRDTAWIIPFYQAGFNVLMFDFRGHGGSEGEIVSLGYFERLDLLGAIDFLKQRGIDRVGVIGFSMGAAVAIAVAKENPAIAAVISDSGYVSLKRLLAGVARERGVPDGLSQMMANLLLWYAGQQLRVDLAAYEPGRAVDANFLCPLLLIQGDNDPYVPVEDTQALAQRAGGPTDVWITPGVEHRATREQHPELYAQRALEFFTKWLRTL